MPVVLRPVPSSVDDGDSAGVGFVLNNSSLDAAVVSAYYEANGYAAIADTCHTAQRSAYRLSYVICGHIAIIADLPLDMLLM